MTFKYLLADRTVNMKASAIREALKVLMRPGMISLAGGLPAPESFPVDLIEEICTKVLRKYSTQALQYGPTEGFPPLREAVVGLLAERGIDVTADRVIITTGSQGSLDSLGKILISKGDPVAVEAPTYMGALSAFNPYEPSYISIATDDNGVIPEELDNLLRKTSVKFVYLIPTFQNPSGRTTTLERRQQVAEIITRHNALLVEDDPYSALRFRGEALPTIKSMAPDNVVYLTTFSKIMAPGLRLGICAAPPDIQNWMVLANQGINLHTSTFDQAIASEYLAGGYLKRQLPKIVEVYRPKLLAMLEALDKYFPDSFRWSRPDGGMFVWAEGPDGFNADDYYMPAVESGVAFVSGQYFYTRPGDGLNTMRLNFTNADVPTIHRGVRILAEVLKSKPVSVGK